MLIGKEKTHDIGFYKDDLMHGYAKLFYKDKVKEGLFENGHFRKKVTDYDAKTDFIAQKIKWDNYII